MMGARGVALGLGKINLNDLNSLPLAERKAALAHQKKMEEEMKIDKPKIIIKKHVDRQVTTCLYLSYCLLSHYTHSPHCTNFDTDYFHDENLFNYTCSWKR